MASRPAGTRQHTIRYRLAGLVAACFLPICLIASLLVVHSYQQKRALIDQHLQSTAHALSLTLDSEIGNIRSALLALASSPHLDKGDLAGFHAQAREVLQSFPGADIILADATGQQLVNTYRAFGDKLPRRNAPDLVARIFETGEPVIGNVFLGAVTKRPLVAVDVPVKAGTKVIYDLSMTLPAQHLAAILERQNLPAHWVGTIVDGKRVIVGRTIHGEERVGKPIGQALNQALDRQRAGLLTAPNADGVKVFAAFSQSDKTGWSIVIAVPTEVVEAELWNWLQWSVGAVLALLVLGLALAAAIAAAIARSIRRLVEPAMALGRGEAVAVSPSGLQETDAVGDALAKAARLHAARAEERDRAEQALIARTRQLEHQYESLRSLNDIAALPQADAASQLAEALAVGLRHLGLKIGIISQIDGQKYTVLHHAAPEDSGLADGMAFDLGNTYCALTVESDTVVAIDHMAKSPHSGHPCYRTFKLESYIGAQVIVDGRPFGTVNFSAPYPAPHGFDEGDLEFMQLMARWVGAVLEREAVHRELERSNAELEQFAYVASHDLREPLRQVASYVTLLERRHFDEFDEESREFIGFARDGARRMDRLILDLLEYSRIGRHERKLAEVDLAAVMTEVRGYLEEVAAKCGAEITLPPSLPKVIGDHTELVRLFQNLIGNALKYRAPDRTPKVEIYVRREGRTWVVSVADNGIGIAPEHHDRIFRIFQRLHGQGKYEGTGIGLAAAKKIVEHLNGKIWLESAVGQGSRFFVSLPAAGQ